MALFRRCNWTMVSLAGLILLLSCLTSFLGFFANFTGRGDESLQTIGMNTISYSMTAALPVFLVVGAFSRRALVWVYLVLYLLASAGVYILETANCCDLAEPLKFAVVSPLWSARRALGALGSISVLCLFLAALTEILFRIERRKQNTPDVIASDAG